MGRQHGKVSQQIPDSPASEERTRISGIHISQHHTANATAEHRAQLKSQNKEIKIPSPTARAGGEALNLSWNLMAISGLNIPIWNAKSALRSTAEPEQSTTPHL